MKADRKRLRRAIGAATRVEGPLDGLRRLSDTYTPDQRARLARFILADLPADGRAQVAARHLVPTLPPVLRRRCAAEPEVAAAIIGEAVARLEPLHRHFPRRLATLRHDLP